MISEQGIRAALKEECQTIPIVIKKEMTSTNIEAKQAAALKPIHGMLFVAEQQTAGRGRRGRRCFNSSGIVCVSILKLMPIPTTMESICPLSQSVTASDKIPHNFFPFL